MNRAIDAPAPRLAGELASLLDGSLRLEDFVATIVHEAAQPLTAIQMLAGALRDAGDTFDAAERGRLLTDIQKQAQFLRELSGWMLQPFARETVVFDELVEHTAERCRALAPKHRIITQTDAGGLQAECETVRVEASIRNLVCNAAKHSPAGSRITIRTYHRDKKAVVSVSDEGEGIPHAEWEHVFEPYVRLDDNAPGAGLGLHLVSSCAMRHGGIARVGASGPSGTTMELSLRAIT